MQSTQVRPLIWEDSICRRATKLLCRNYWTGVPRACSLQRERPSQWEASAPQLNSSSPTPQLEKARVQQRRPGAAKNKSIKYTLLKNKIKKCYKIRLVSKPQRQWQWSGGKERVSIRLGSLQSSGAEQRHGEGQAALVVLAVEAQHALYSSSLNKTRMPGLMLWFSAHVCKWCQSHSITARKSILIVSMLFWVRGSPGQAQSFGRWRVPGTILEITQNILKIQRKKSASWLIQT